MAAEQINYRTPFAVRDGSDIEQINFPDAVDKRLYVGCTTVQDGNIPLIVARLNEDGSPASWKAVALLSLADAIAFGESLIEAAKQG